MKSGIKIKKEDLYKRLNLTAEKLKVCESTNLCKKV
jgi:hypothetical protein